MMQLTPVHDLTTCCGGGVENSWVFNLTYPPGNSNTGCSSPSGV